MKNHSELEQLLQTASSVGRLESRGSFTIAGEAAIGKLASFQLPRPSAWILKIVQAAVVGGASELRIAQSNETTTFAFPTSLDFTVEELKEALLSPHLGGQSMPAHLAVGLRAVGFGDKRAFTLALDGEGQRTYLGWDGETLAQRAVLTPEASNRAIHLGVAFPPEDLGRAFMGLAKSKGRATAEYTEVVDNGEVCPIPLYLDGRRIDRMQAPGRDQIVGNSVILCLGWYPPGSPELPVFPRPTGLAPSDFDWRPTDRFTDQRPFHLDGLTDDARVGALVKLRYNYHVENHRSKHKSFTFRSISTRSYINWVRHGVVVHREMSRRPSSPVPFELYLSAEGLPSDVSGLSVQTSVAAQDRANSAQMAVNLAVDGTLAAIEKHIPKPFGVHSLLYGGLGAVMAAAMPLTLGKSVVGAFFLINLGLSAYDKRQIMMDCKFHLSRLKRSY